MDASPQNRQTKSAGTYRGIRTRNLKRGTDHSAWASCETPSVQLCTPWPGGRDVSCQLELSRTEPASVRAVPLLSDGCAPTGPLWPSIGAYVKKPRPRSFPAIEPIDIPLLWERLTSKGALAW